MKTIAQKQEEQKAVRDAQRKADDADMIAVAKLFNTEEGKNVLELLMRRSGVLGSRFAVGSKGAVCPLRAAYRDGQAEMALFILKCQKKAGVNHITLPI